LTWGTDLGRLESGELVPMHPHRTTERVIKVVEGRRRYVYPLRRHDAARYWPLPPAGWQEVDFDDGDWARMDARFCHGDYGSRKRGYKSMQLLCLRGRFRVADPARTRRMTVTVRFQGGAVVYVNGRELARAFLPAGELAPSTPGVDYPQECFFDANGLPWEWTAPREDPVAKKAFEKRIRTLTAPVPASMLRAGVNVVAVEVHRSPAPAKFFTTSKSRKYVTLTHVQKYCWWPRLAVESVTLTAAGGAGVEPNAGHTGRPKGMQVWSAPLHRYVFADDYGDPFEPPARIRMTAARNAVCSAQLAVSADTPIRGLSARASAVRSDNGRIPASAVEVRYGLPDGRAHPQRGPLFDGLERFAPQTVPVLTGLGGEPVFGAVQPIWVTVRVPAEAGAGQYGGTVTINADGREPTVVPVTLQVVDWRMPPSREFFTHLGLIQSPDSVAMKYGVPMWSDAHWRLLERTFRLLGEVGNKVVWITPQRKTHFGNEHAMIRFTRGADGELSPDLSIAERYVELAVRHQGKVPVVALYAWRSPWETGHFGHHRPQDRLILISVLDPDTGALQKADGPRWGTPECRRFWRPVFDGMKRILAKHGIADSLMIGVAGDYMPTDTSLADLAAASGGLPWVFHAHVVRHALGTKKDHRTAYIADGWGGHCRHIDPEFGRGYGWKNDFRRCQTRGFPSNPTWQRLHLESLVTARIIRRKADDQPDYGLHGMGRVGADFWPVIRGRGGRLSYLAERYPETAWGQLSLRCCGTAVLAAGRDGAIGTVRLERFRENVQEIEARIFIEKALHDEAERGKLGPRLAAHALALLDERTRACNRAAHYRESLASGIQQRQAAIYRLAAEVARALRR
jgi:hypothetical protein